MTLPLLWLDDIVICKHDCYRHGHNDRDDGDSNLIYFFPSTYLYVISQIIYITNEKNKFRLSAKRTSH